MNCFESSCSPWLLLLEPMPFWRVVKLLVLKVIVYVPTFWKIEIQTRYFDNPKDFEKMVKKR